MCRLTANWWSKLFYILIIFVALDTVRYQIRHFSDDGYDNALIDGNLTKLWRRDGMQKLTPLRKDNSTFMGNTFVQNC